MRRIELKNALHSQNISSSLSLSLSLHLFQNKMTLVCETNTCNLRNSTHYQKYFINHFSLENQFKINFHFFLIKTKSFAILICLFRYQFGSESMGSAIYSLLFVGQGSVSVRFVLYCRGTSLRIIVVVLNPTV